MQVWFQGATLTATKQTRNQQKKLPLSHTKNVKTIITVNESK